MKKHWYAPTPDELVADMDQLRQMLTDILIPAKFQPKPSTFTRQALKEALAIWRYDRPVVQQAMRNALRWPQPDVYLRRKFAQAMAAIEQVQEDHDGQ